MLNDTVEWPIVLFDDRLSPAIVSTSELVLEVREPPYFNEIRYAFDRKYWRLRIASEADGIVEVRRVSEKPEPEAFRRVARVALRLYGPNAVWRRWRLIHSDDRPSLGISADELWQLLSVAHTVD